MATIANLMVKLGADTSNFNVGMAKASSGLAAFAGKAGALLGGAMLARGLWNFAKDSMKLASGLVEVQNVIDTTFGSGAGAVNEFAKNAKAKFGLSELAAKDFASTMGATMKSSGISGKPLVDMSLGLTGLAGDFTSFRNIPIEEMFQKIRAGMVGEIEPMRNIGINMSVVNLEAFAMSQGIKKSYESMLEAEKVVLRYNYLLSKTSDVQGDFTKTQASFANQSRIAQLNWETFSATMGAGFSNIAYGVITWFNGIAGSIQNVAMNFRVLTAVIFGDSSKQGASTIKAAKGTDKLTGSQNNLKKAVGGVSKEIKGSLASIDQLNILQRKAASGGGGGGGGDEFEVPEMPVFTVPELPELLPNWARQVAIVKLGWDQMWENIVRDIKNLPARWDSLKTEWDTFWSDAGKGFNLVFGPIKTKLGHFWDGVQESYNLIMDPVKKRFSDFMIDLKGNIELARLKWVAFWTAGNGGAIDVLIEKWGGFWGLSNTKMDAMKGKWNLFWSEVNFWVGYYGERWDIFWWSLGVGFEGMKEDWAKFWAPLNTEIDKFMEKWDSIFKPRNPDIKYTAATGTGSTWKPGTTTQPVNPPTFGGIRQFAVGTDYVPFTGPAIVHKGEKITPAGQNQNSNIEALLRELIATSRNQAAPMVTVKVGERTIRDIIVETNRNVALQSGRRV